MGFPILDLRPRRSAWWTVAGLIAVPSVGGAAFLLTGPLTGNWTYAPGGVVCVAIAALVIGLFLAAQRRDGRTRARLLSQSPPGTVFVARAQPLRVRRRGGRNLVVRSLTARTCLVAVDHAGITVIGSKDPSDLPDRRVAWSELDLVSVDPVRPLGGVVKASLRTGELLAWQVNAAAQLAVVLDDLAAASGRPGPTAAPGVKST